MQPWWEFFKRLYTRINEHALLARSAQLSYYFLLAMFPLLVFLVTLLGYFVQEGSQLRNSMLTYLGTVMPYSAITLVRATLDEISEVGGGGRLSFSLLAALWVASSGMGAISDTLNVAYNAKETRSWWHVRLVSIALTVGLTILIMAALLLVFYGGKIGDTIAMNLGYSLIFAVIWRVVQWPIILCFVLLTFELTYCFAPNLPWRRWRWLTPGGAVAVALWLLVSFGLRFYLHFFNSYSRTYGSLGALIVLMLWFYLTGMAVLLGGEINSEIEGEPLVKDDLKKN